MILPASLASLSVYSWNDLRETNLSKCLAVLRILNGKLLLEIVESSINLNHKSREGEKLTRNIMSICMPITYKPKKEIPAFEGQSTPYRNPWTEIWEHPLLEKEEQKQIVLAKTSIHRMGPVYAHLTKHHFH